MIFYSALDVMNNKKKYPEETKRIKQADLKYPIIITGTSVVDGVHRLAKSHMTKKKNIKAYVFDKKLMKKFLIPTPKSKTINWNKINNLEMHYFIELFHKRFKK